MIACDRCGSLANRCPAGHELLYQTHICTFCVSDAQPTEGEREVWNQVNAVLQDSENILLGLQAYKGAGQEIRDVRRGNTHTHTKHCVLSLQNVTTCPI